MKTFYEYLLKEADLPGGSPLGASLGAPGAAPGGGIASPATGPAGLGSGGPAMPPGGGGMPPVGGASGGGAPPGMDPSGGMDQQGAGGMGQMQPPTKYKTSNVWDVLEKILDGKKIGVEKDKNAGPVPANPVSSEQLPQNNAQLPPTQPTTPTNPQQPAAPPTPGQLPAAVPGSLPQ